MTNQLTEQEIAILHDYGFKAIKPSEDIPITNFGFYKELDYCNVIVHKNFELYHLFFCYKNWSKWFMCETTSTFEGIKTSLDKIDKIEQSIMSNLIKGIVEE